MYTIRTHYYKTPQKPVILRFKDQETFIKKSNEILKDKTFIIELVSTQRSSKRSKDLFIIDLKSLKLNLNITLYIDFEGLENFFNMQTDLKDLNIHIYQFRKSFNNLAEVIGYFKSNIILDYQN